MISSILSEWCNLPMPLFCKDSVIIDSLLTVTLVLDHKYGPITVTNISSDFNKLTTITSHLPYCIHIQYIVRSLSCEGCFYVFYTYIYRLLLQAKARVHPASSLQDPYWWQWLPHKVPTAPQGANCTWGAIGGFSILLKDTSAHSSVPPRGSQGFELATFQSHVIYQL